MAAKNAPPQVNGNGKAPAVNRVEKNLDEVYLQAFEHRLQLVRDRVIGVVNGYSTGFYLHGDGGTSKTFTVEQTLRQVNAHYILTNSQMTGKGLFELLEAYPMSIHLLDDLETLFTDKKSHGVLRSALWGGNDNTERMITWQIGSKRSEVIFTGGIIMIANVPMEQLAALKALKTRISVLKHQPTEDEIVAIMRGLAAKGYASRGLQLSPEECMEVVSEVVTISRKLKKTVDLRLFVNGLMDRLQHMAGHSQTHWLDMLESRINERSARREDVQKLLGQIPKSGNYLRGKN